MPVNTPATPNSIGGAFSSQYAYFPSLVVTSQDGGRVNQAGFVGSGTTVTINNNEIDDGSATTLTGNWFSLYYSEGQKRDIWNPDTDGLGSLEPHLGNSGAFFVDFHVSSPFPGTMSYFDNDFAAGVAGVEYSWYRNSTNWGVLSSQPQPASPDVTSVKSYPDTQFTFDTPYPAISSFSSIRAYYAGPSPLPPAGVVTDYEAAFDIFGIGTHTGRAGITLEVMFWTRNHNQSPFIGPLVEQNVDLNDGRGPVWDLFMTPDTAATGGINDNYSFFIWYLQDAHQEDAGWINILNGVRYAVQYYVVPSGAGAPSNPLNCTLYQVTRGWEICSTNYTPTQFELLDYRLVMS